MKNRLAIILITLIGVLLTLFLITAIYGKHENIIPADRTLDEVEKDKSESVNIIANNSLYLNGSDKKEMLEEEQYVDYVKYENLTRVYIGLDSINSLDIELSDEIIEKINYNINNILNISEEEFNELDFEEYLEVDKLEKAKELDNSNNKDIKELMNDKYKIKLVGKSYYSPGLYIYKYMNELNEDSLTVVIVETNESGGVIDIYER